MPIVDMTVRLALALVLVAAVFGKLRTARSRRDYAGMFPAMGVPEALIRPAAVALVVAEAVTAVLLLTPSTATAGAAASLAALVLSLGGAAPGLPETAVAAFAALVIAAVVVRIDDLVSLLR